METDYALLASSGGIHVAAEHSGASALVIELANIPAEAVGRRAAGCELVPHASLVFRRETDRWSAPAAALVCRDAELLDAFIVFTADVERRVIAGTRDWASIVAAVEEWQSLMAPRGRPSAEAEIGLWGELWLLTVSASPSRLLAGWRGPDSEAVDFQVDGKSVEVKSSRHSRQHHVSLSQVVEPAGDVDSWLLSIWVGVDPVRGQTVPELVDRLLPRLAQPADALRRIAAAGYVHGDRANYEHRFVLLREPEWYAVRDVPRVRAVDPGVSLVRYVVALDEARCARDAAPSLWRHFLDGDFRSTSP